RHTRLVSDWSSDVCSSDLQAKNLRLGRESGLLGYWPLTPETVMFISASPVYATQAKDLISGCDAGSTSLEWGNFAGWIPSDIDFQQLQLDVSSFVAEDLLNLSDGENLTNIDVLKNK